MNVGLPLCRIGNYAVLRLNTAHSRTRTEPFCLSFQIWDSGNTVQRSTVPR
jgi:hypothetical protein